MKRAIQPNVRKVYGASMQPIQQQHQQHHQESQINAVRKIHNLLSSGAVTVTGPTQSKILKQKVAGSTIATIQNNQSTVQRCYVCDDPAGNQPMLLAEAVTATSNTKLPNKIGQILGQGYMVIISVEDLVCKRCVAMINHLDRLEADSERVKKNVLNYLVKKYNLSDDDGQMTTVTTSSPGVKMQRLNSGNVVNRKITAEDDQEGNVTRKITVHSVQTTRDQIDNQLSNIFDSGDNKQQITITQTKLATPAQPQSIIHQQQQPQAKKQTKIYKCLSCDFKTTDYKQFQPHYETCKQQNGFQCRTCKKIFSNPQALKQHVTEKHPTDNTCSICNISFINESTLKKHIESIHPEFKIVEAANIPNVQQTTTFYSCSTCQYKTTDKPTYDEHIKKHVKTKPFKCRLCSVRFETREQACVHAKSHQPNYFKCGTCSVSFTQRDLLVKHFEVHQHQTQNKIQIQQQQQQSPQQSQQQQQQPQTQTQILTTQKLLQDTIDEALREPSEGLDTKGIHFFSCNVCSLTFIQENYYNQHMETHKRDNKKTNIVTSTSQNLIRQETRNTSSNVIATTTQSNAISEADIESIFEKMHSDKAEGENSSGGQTNENLVITSQENSVGGITFNITIPQENTDQTKNAIKTEEQQPPTTSASEGISVGIDMPVLDEPVQCKTEPEVPVSESSIEQQNEGQSAPVSMPSLEDEGDSQSQPSNTDQVPMDLDDIQNSVESGQIKFILNENGQILQLDNHIITTDADGNQILVQGTDSEQLQQLLQSVGVLQSGDGLDGETLQMIGENNQMIIVQQGDNEAQLIDASLLNADGHIVIQQAQDGELPEGAHVPVSVAFTSGHEQGIHLETNSVEQQDESDNQSKDDHDKKSDIQQNQNGVSTEQTIVTTTTQQTLPTSTGEAFFALEDLMQQPEQKSD